MREIKVKNVMIGKQFEDSENYREFLEIVKEKNIKVKIVEAGDRINIEENLYFDILWPYSDDKITDNILNNGSLVCKLVYKEFSMLSVGDVEEIAEKEILKTYQENLNIFKSVVLKVAHHGAKTSSTKEFLNVVKPQIALIGVGQNNKFGHPSHITLENLKGQNSKVYRTDECGEITIKTKGKKIRINKMIR